MINKSNISKKAEEREKILKNKKHENVNKSDFDFFAKHEERENVKIIEVIKEVKVPVEKIVEVIKEVKVNKYAIAKTKKVTISLNKQAELIEDKIKNYYEKEGLVFNRSGEYLEHLKAKLENIKKQEINK